MLTLTGGLILWCHIYKIAIKIREFLYLPKDGKEKETKENYFQDVDGDI